MAALVLAGAMATARAQEASAPPADTDCATAAWPLDGLRARLAAPAAPEIASGGALDPQAGAAALVLRLPSEVVFAHPPGRPAPPDAFAGTFPLPIPRAGLWQVTLSDAAWVDLVAGGRLLPVVAFTGVHRCPGVRKSLRFEVPQGEAMLQLSGAATARLKVLITPLD